MLSPRYLIVPPTTKQNSRMSETSLQSPVSNNANNFVTYQPIRCIQTIMPPPPNNILTTISNNNNISKSYNKNNIWNSAKKPLKEVKQKKCSEDDNEKDISDSQCNNSPKTTPENKGVKRVHEKNNVNQSVQHNFYNSNSQNNNAFNHYYPFFSPNQRVNNFNKNRYFTNRSGNNKNKKQIINHDGHNELVNTLIERFLSRSSIVEIHGHPEELVSGNEWDTLSCQIWEYYLNTQQTEKTYKNKIMLWKYLYTFIKTLFPRYGLFLVGSTMSGFGTNTSDVDMCLLVRYSNHIDQRSEALFILEHIKKSLLRCEFVQRVELICAKVPILKFHDTNRNLDVDLNCNNCVGIRNTHLLHCYASLDWRVRALVLVVKMWARSNNINDAKTMTISSYSLALMVIHFLQCGATPPVIPCLHGLYPSKFHTDSDIHSLDMQEQLHSFHSDNHQSLGELLLEFLHYYTMFPYNMYAISIRLGAKIPIDECRLARSLKNDPHQWKYLCIEEPFDLTNTARSVYDPDVFEKIKNVFVKSFNKLHDTRDLFSIFNLNDTNNI